MALGLFLVAGECLVGFEKGNSGINQLDEPSMVQFASVLFPFAVPQGSRAGFQGGFPPALSFFPKLALIEELRLHRRPAIGISRNVAFTHGSLFGVLIFMQL